MPWVEGGQINIETLTLGFTVRLDGKTWLLGRTEMINTQR